MPLGPDDLFTRFDNLGIEVKTMRHPPLFTVAESQALRGQLPGGHTKNLFLKDKKGAIFLIVAEEDAAIDLKRIHSAIGAQGRVSFGKPDLLMEVLGVIPGAVTPFALINDEADKRVSLVLDRRLLAHDMLNFHPLDNERTTQIARHDFEAFLAALGYEPAVLDLPGPEGI
ncbi:MAG: YbaK/EbsC family protein [Pseudomonadota bacterium]